MQHGHLRGTAAQVSLFESDAVKSIKGAAQLRALWIINYIFTMFISVDVRSMKLHHIMPISIHSMKHLKILMLFMYVAIIKPTSITV